MPDSCADISAALFLTHVIVMQEQQYQQARDDPSQSLPQVTRLACGSTGIVAAGYSDGSIRLWDPETAECKATLHGHRNGISALALSANAELLASGARDTDIVVWDTAGESGLYRLKGHTDQVNGVAFLDGENKLLSSGKDACLRVWDLATQHCSQTITHDAGATKCSVQYTCHDDANHALDKSGKRMCAGCNSFSCGCMSAFCSFWSVSKHAAVATCACLQVRSGPWR